MNVHKYVYPAVYSLMVIALDPPRGPSASCTAWSQTVGVALETYLDLRARISKIWLRNDVNVCTLIGIPPSSLREKQTRGSAVYSIINAWPV